MALNQERADRLKKYVEGVFKNANGRDLYFSYVDDINSVTPQECFEVFYSKIEEGYSPKQILEILDKVINVFYDSLTEFQWVKPIKDSFVDIMMRENKALEDRLNDIKKVVKLKDVNAHRSILLEKIRDLEAFNDHYLKKENILFPYMERAVKRFEGLTIMWSLHDEARSVIKRMISMLEGTNIDDFRFNVEIGELFFTLLGLVTKEDLIMFPSAMAFISEEEWDQMNAQSLDYNFPFIERPLIEVKERKEEVDFRGFKFKSETGELDFDQILMIFNTLPIDFTYVDENNKVRYFSSPKDRIFPRSPAVIGRDVSMCHPQESVHIVEDIVEKFRSGEEESASFWINLRGRTILIQYFAMRNDKGDYKGVLEASQDITEIKALEGERRLLQWEKID